MDDVAVMLDRFRANFELIEMAWAAHDEVVERTGNFREGHYSARRLRDLLRSLNHVVDADSGPHEQLEALLQHQRNILATFGSEIERLDG